MEYDAFGYTDTEGSGFTLDGTLNIAGDFSKKDASSWNSCDTSDFTVVISDAKDKGSFETIYTAYSMEGDISEVLLEGAAGDVTVAGEASVTGLGSMGFSGAMGSTTACLSEIFDNGSVEIEGAETLTVTFDGAKTCDDCLPWSTSDGSSGEICDPF